MNKNTVKKTAPQTSVNAIEVSNATVAYRSYKERPTTLKESFLQLIKKRTFRYYETFNALTDVSFNIPQGAVFGIIGSNGSGKSTLLKVMSGVLKPTIGNVKRNGIISSLIELGAGFDPELNAIENIYLYCSLYGKKREEIQSRITPILDFAELQDFATTPIKYYSSGMFARLGFSVAVDINPDILLVDEILGVGDERFYEKCIGVFQRFIAQKKTIVIVSHDMQQIQTMCSKALLLSRGNVAFQGDPAEAVEIYRQDNYQTALKD